MSKVVLHFFQWDEQFASLWAKTSFDNFVEKLRGYGVKYVVAPEFSNFLDMPAVMQLHNHYKSAVLAKDFQDAGFTVLPFGCWGCELLWPVSMLWWSGPGTCIVDANHEFVPKGDFYSEVFWRGAKEFSQLHSKSPMVLLTRREKVVEKWKLVVGPAQWLPTRCRMIDELGKARRKVSCSTQ
jgi:hypothetical protein